MEFDTLTGIILDDDYASWVLRGMNYLHRTSA